MIDFKNKDELPTSLVILGSLALMLAAGGCILFLPKPAMPTPAANAKQEKKIMDQVTQAKQDVATAKVGFQSETWDGDPEAIGPVALKQINGLLQSRHLKLVGFHSQKAIDQPNITLMPFVVSVEGSFPSVVAFAKDLEQPSTKLVIELMQISNANQTDDKVTASVGVDAYQLPQTANPVKPDSKTPTPVTTPTNTTMGAKKNA